MLSGLQKSVLAQRTGIFLAVAGVAGLEWMAPQWLHDAAVVRLYFLPVIWAALYDGWRGGVVIASISASALMLHAFALRVVVPGSIFNHSTEAVWLYVIGALVGIPAGRQRRQKEQYRTLADQLSSVYEKVQANFEGMKRAERLSAIGQLSAGLAHEIRNPLASISGAAGILQRTQRLDSRGQKCLDIITNECRRLNGLLTNFLNFARPRAPHLQLVQLDPILDNVIALASHAIRGKTVNLQKLTAQNLPSVECDPEQLEQVLLNLMINAIEASPENEPVTLSAGASGASVAIRVIDYGHGVAAADIDKLFDPFFTTKENGTGLGLSVAHQIVRQMGGSLVAERNPEKGMTFSVILPPKQTEYESSSNSGSRRRRESPLGATDTT
ncbi:MAG: sensor histidine kinase [Bryobacteraceae bacterium]|nr:hypothetical protein [Bryobacterales bacterium]MEB2359806.1 ATP-binding protein [Bryobacterales bacterium]NUN01230.1 sensor histidine kinase [Bryobacteraceae bacterium]